jgi:DNA-binding protein WhiA
MSFSANVKEDLTRVVSHKKCCRHAELTAFLRMSGNIHINNRELSLSMTTEYPAVARKMFMLAKDFDLDMEIVIHRKARLRKNQVFMLRIPPQEKVKELLLALGFMDIDKIWQMDFPGQINRDMLKKDCCRRAYLRGAFLAGGSINNPEGAYHLEISCNDRRHAMFLKEIMNGFDIAAKITTRKQNYVVYLKEGEQIITLLNIIGSYRSLLEFESTRVVKDVRNQVNRLVNCENANLDKTVTAGMRQVNDIKEIEEAIGLIRLPKGLAEVAALRLEYPESSLSELSNISQIGRSAINHRLRRLSEIAENIRTFGMEEWDKK